MCRTHVMSISHASDPAQCTLFTGAVCPAKMAHSVIIEGGSVSRLCMRMGSRRHVRAVWSSEHDASRFSRTLMQSVFTSFLCPLCAEEVTLLGVGFVGK